jgi:hypothetical protein
MLHRHLLQADMKSPTPAQNRPPTGGSHVAYPVRPLAEHGYQVLLSLVIGHHHREGDPAAAASPLDLKRRHSLRPHPGGKDDPRKPTQGTRNVSGADLPPYSQRLHVSFNLTTLTSILGRPERLISS